MEEDTLGYIYGLDTKILERFLMHPTMTRSQIEIGFPKVRGGAMRTHLDWMVKNQLLVHMTVQSKLGTIREVYTLPDLHAPVMDIYRRLGTKVLIDSSDDYWVENTLTNNMINGSRNTLTGEYNENQGIAWGRDLIKDRDRSDALANLAKADLGNDPDDLPRDPRFANLYE